MLIATFFLVLIAGLLFPQFRNYEKKYYIIFASVCMALIIGLRHRTCFGDSPYYVNGYHNIAVKTYEKVLLTTSKDVGFWIFSKVIGDASGYNYTIWFLVLGVSFVIPVSYLINKYSRSPIFSYLILFSLGFFLFAMTGLRQTLAISFILVSFLFLQKRKLLPFILTVAFAALFHKTALIFLIAYPMTALPFNKFTLTGYAVLAVLVNVFGKTLLQIFMTSDDRFASYSDFQGSNTSGLVIQLLILLFSLYFLQDEKDSEENRVLFHLCLLGCIFQSAAIFIAEMFRVSMYFSIFNIILFANAIDSTYKDTVLSIAKPATFVALCFYWIIMVPSSQMEYFFFWALP